MWARPVMWPWKEQAVGELLLSWYRVPHRRHLFRTIIFSKGWCRYELDFRLPFEDALTKVLGFGFAVLIWKNPWSNSAIRSWLSSFRLSFFLSINFLICYGRRNRTRTAETTTGCCFLIGLHGILSGLLFVYDIFLVVHIKKR
jgi:hypothetical protein